MDRAGQARSLKFRNHRKANRIEPLHVAGAAAIHTAVLKAQREGIACPGLPLDRDDIGVPGEDDASIMAGPDGGKKRGFIARGIGNFYISNAKGF